MLHVSCERLLEVIMDLCIYTHGSHESWHCKLIIIPLGNGYIALAFLRFPVLSFKSRDPGNLTLILMKI
jgi:hypothetical protein